MIEAVIFDMDGVLTETSHEHFIAWKRLAEKLGCSLPADVKDAIRGVSRSASLEIVLHALNLENKFTEQEKYELTELKNCYYIESIQKFILRRPFNAFQHMFNNFLLYDQILLEKRLITFCNQG